MSTWGDMASEMAARELLEAEDRVRDLEGERDAYGELLKLTLAQLHALMARERRLTRRVRDLLALARRLRPRSAIPSARRAA